MPRSPQPSVLATTDDNVRNHCRRLVRAGPHRTEVSRHYQLKARAGDRALPRYQCVMAPEADDQGENGHPHLQSAKKTLSTGRGLRPAASLCFPAKYNSTIPEEDCMKFRPLHDRVVVQRID